MDVTVDMSSVVVGVVENFMEYVVRERTLMATARLTASATRASATAASRIRPSANRDKTLYY